MIRVPTTTLGGRDRRSPASGSTIRSSLRAVSSRCGAGEMDALSRFRTAGATRRRHGRNVCSIENETEERVDRRVAPLMALNPFNGEWFINDILQDYAPDDSNTRAAVQFCASSATFSHVQRSNSKNKTISCGTTEKGTGELVVASQCFQRCWTVQQLVLFHRPWKAGCEFGPSATVFQPLRAKKSKPNVPAERLSVCRRRRDVVPALAFPRSKRRTSNNDKETARSCRRPRSKPIMDQDALACIGLR